MPGSEGYRENYVTQAGHLLRLQVCIAHACLERSSHSRTQAIVDPLTDGDNVVEMVSVLPRVTHFIQHKPIPFTLRKTNAQRRLITCPGYQASSGPDILLPFPVNLSASSH